MWYYHSTMLLIVIHKFSYASPSAYAENDAHWKLILKSIMPVAPHSKKTVNLCKITDSTTNLHALNSLTNIIIIANHLKISIKCINLK